MIDPQQRLLAQRLLRKGETIRAVAKKVGVGKSTLSRWRASGKIRATVNRPGRPPILRASELRHQLYWTVSEVVTRYGVSRWTARRVIKEIRPHYWNGLWCHRRWSRRKRVPRK